VVFRFPSVFSNCHGVRPRTKILIEHDKQGTISSYEEGIEEQESIEKMDIPFRRVVTLTAMGLVTGALLRLLYETLRETNS
jgi:hypothetical protein